MEKKHLYLSVVMPCFWFDRRPATLFCYTFCLVAAWTVNQSVLILSVLLGDNELKRCGRFKHLA